MAESVRSLVLSAVLALAVFVYYLATWQTIDGFVVSLDHCRELFCDFIEVYYPTGKSFLESRTPPSGYFYSPTFALFLTLFSLGSLNSALWLWGTFQVLTILLLGTIPALYFFYRSRYQFGLYVFLYLASMPVLHNFKWGQLSVFLTLCVLGSILFYRKDLKLPSAILLSLATSVKFFAVIFLIYALLKRDVQYVGIFLISAFLVLMVFPSFVLGFDDTWQAYRLLQATLYHAAETWVPKATNSQYIVHVFDRFAATTSKHTMFEIESIRPLIRALGYGVFGVNIYTIFRLNSLKLENEDYLAFMLLFLSLPFVVETSWPHYFVYLPCCQVLEIGYVRDLKDRLLLALSIILSNIVLFNLIGDWVVFSYIGCLFFSNLLLLVFVQLQLWSGRRLTTI